MNQAQAAFPFVAFYKISEKRGSPMHSSREVFEEFREDAQAAQEHIRAVYLDTKNRMMESHVEFIGTVDSSAVYPREIFKRAILIGAACLILVHNHPSGDPEPSLCDKAITRDTAAGGSLLGIKLLDHIIIGAKVNGKQAYYSMADHGDIES